MVSVDEESTETKKRSSSAPRKGKRKKPPIPQTEAEIDSPDRLTLVVIGFMGVVTLVLWGFARGACNYHPPRETRRPRPVKTEELARDPKDAALEFQQRYLMRNYAGALELATGDLVPKVQAAKADCEKNIKTCAMERMHLEKNVHSAPALLERSPSGAVVRVTSQMDGKKEVSLITLERDGAIWKARSRVPDDGTFKPQEPPDGPSPLGMHPPVEGSAEPAGSAMMIPMPTGSGASRTFVVRPPTTPGGKAELEQVTPSGAAPAKPPAKSPAPPAAPPPAPPPAPAPAASK